MNSSKIIDKNGIEVKEGDRIQFYYIDPMGKINYDVLGDIETVEFKYGAFGYQTPIKFVPLFYWVGEQDGKYIPNQGTERIYTNKYPFYVLT